MRLNQWIRIWIKTMFTWNVFASISFNIRCKWTFCISYFFSGSHYQRCRATSVVKRNIVPTVFFFTMVFLLRLFRKSISLLSSLFHSNRFLLIFSISSISFKKANSWNAPKKSVLFDVEKYSIRRRYVNVYEYFLSIEPIFCDLKFC